MTGKIILGGLAVAGIYALLKHRQIANAADTPTITVEPAPRPNPLNTVHALPVTNIRNTGFTLDTTGEQADGTFVEPSGERATVSGYNEIRYIL